MSNTRDQHNQDDAKVHNGNYYQHGVPITIWNVTYAASDSIEMVRGRPVTLLRRDQDDVQMQDDSEPDRMQVSAPDKVKLAQKVQDCFEDIEEKNDAIAEQLDKLRQRFSVKDYKTIYNNFMAERSVHQVCLNSMKGLFEKFSKTLPDCQESQLLIDERGVFGLQQSLENLEKSQRNLRKLITMLRTERVVFGNQSRLDNQRVTERFNQPRRQFRRHRQNPLLNNTIPDQHISQAVVSKIDGHLKFYNKQNLNIVEAMQDLTTLCPDESEFDSDDNH